MYLLGRARIKKKQAKKPPDFNLKKKSSVFQNKTHTFFKDLFFYWKDFKVLVVDIIFHILHEITEGVIRTPPYTLWSKHFYCTHHSPSWTTYPKLFSHLSSPLSSKYTQLLICVTNCNYTVFVDSTREQALAPGLSGVDWHWSKIFGAKSFWSPSSGEDWSHPCYSTWSQSPVCCMWHPSGLRT